MKHVGKTGKIVSIVDISLRKLLIRLKLHNYHVDGIVLHKKSLIYLLRSTHWNWICRVRNSCERSRALQLVIYKIKVLLGISETCILFTDSEIYIFCSLTSSHGQTSKLIS